MKKYWFYLAGLVALLVLGYGKRALFSAPPEPKTPSGPVLGRIYDVEHRLLAFSQKKKGLILIPQAFEATPENISLLAKLTGRNEYELSLLLATEKNPIFFEAQKEEIPSIPGLITRSYFNRAYPYGDLLLPILGGQKKVSAFEAYYQKILAQKESFLRTNIKVEFQKALRRDLLKHLSSLKAEQGVAVILDLYSGRIRALAFQGSEDLLLNPQINLSSVGAPFEEVYQRSAYQDLTAFVRALGFDEATGIDLPGENPGIIPPEVSSLSEVRVSLIQLVRALGALATGRLISPKLGLEAGLSSGEKYLIAVEGRKIEGLTPKEEGGVWYHGGSRRSGEFVMIGLWPRQRPSLAFGFYAKGVKARGLPYHYTRFIPKAVRLVAQNKNSKEKKQAQRGNALGPFRMPDVRGLTLKAALERLVPLGLEVQFSGFGVTVKQWPAPGAPLKGAKICRLVLK